MTQNTTALECFLLFCLYISVFCVCVFAGESRGKGGQLILGSVRRFFALSFDVLGPRISLITILYLLLAFASFL